LLHEIESKTFECVDSLTDHVAARHCFRAFNNDIQEI
jgi:hypothetical protein